MFRMKGFFYLTLLHLVIATPQINLYDTDWISESENDGSLSHTCLRVISETKSGLINREIVSYCMSELPSKFKIDDNDFPSKFTFAELFKQNITSQQLYLWSTPIDIIEHYQYYLNQLSTSNNSSLATNIFYNCTLPRFGPMCQYELDFYDSHYSSVYWIIRRFYGQLSSPTINLTCYMHVQCDRGPSPSCLDWSEICDGKVDCLDGEYDEEHCWQLEINECQDDEYRCMNGQCIPQSFFRDQSYNLNCLDRSDRIPVFPEGNQYPCERHEPLIVCEDLKCDYTHLTSTCLTNRRHLLLKTVYSNKDQSVREDCWSALKCLFNVLDFENQFYDPNNTCQEIVNKTCPNLLYFPNVPVFFGHIYFVFKKSDTQHLVNEDIGLLYICYNNSRYDALFNINSKMSFNNSSCFLHETISYPSNWSNLWDTVSDTPLRKLYHDLKRYQFIFNYSSEMCNRSNMYQCINSSKCISIHRLMDAVDDCPQMDDENFFEINNTKLIEQTHFKCPASNKYIHKSLIKNGRCDCGYIESDWCDDENLNSFNFKKDISFQTICDGFVELTAIILDGRHETDETECEQWQCNNIYTHCDDLWNCPNGADEVGCISFPTINCSSNHHLCVSPQTNQLMCLPIAKANDGKIDCLGAFDEPALCRPQVIISQKNNNFYCTNQTSQLCLNYYQLCDNHKHCENGDDEQFCTTNVTVPNGYGICYFRYRLDLFDAEKFLCDRTNSPYKMQKIDFSLQKMNMLLVDVSKNIPKTIFSRSSTIQISDQQQSSCHRGLDLRVWLSNTNNITNMTCLCPPSYYGDRCQYQNQRISLTVQFRALSDSWQTLFAIIISLIDDSDQRIIHSYEQFSYLWMRTCQTKFDLYLHYSTRPKDQRKNYSIHIDIYEKDSLVYRGSALFPVIFPFLPVHRLAFIVDIPQSNDQQQSCLSHQCIHGKCIRYSNNPNNVSFCQCDRGWSGRFCTFEHTCNCALNSLCIGISANNRSICVCPRNKFGSRCFLTDSICQYDDNSTCHNGGQCISNTDMMVFDQKFVCICPKGFSGDRCEITDNKLILSFDQNIVLSQSIFIHFIEVFEYNPLVRSTTFQTIPLRQDSVIIYWFRPFHLAFIELTNKNYYLAVVQEFYNQSATIEKMINPSDRCSHISEFFNETFVQWHLLRRIKYYHLPCQIHSPNLSCFYDDVHFCLCYNYGQKRLANCLKFDHNMTFNCQGQSECENGAQCFQDSSTCATRSMCLCPPCFYGRRCQFSTSGFGLSLDAILGYQIFPHLSLSQQPFIVRFSFGLTIIFIMAGLINGILSLITFKNKAVCGVGCGLYLLGSSITTILTMMMFGLKFFILLLAQMTIISNRSFLSFQCHSMDFLLRVCLCMDQWLNACVAAERAMTIMKGPGFVKKKSRQAAKFVILLLSVIIVGSCIHDPIYRRLIDEENEDDQKRIWCIITYPSNLEIYNYVIHIFHFFGPFIINIISAIILITQTSVQQSIVHKQRPYKKILQEQFRQHKRLLVAPIILVLLAVPRLIITFVSKCMKSANDSWLFLVGYLISLIPSMLTFVVFVLPSKSYKKEFRKSIDHYRTILRRRLHLNYLT